MEHGRASDADRLEQILQELKPLVRKLREGAPRAELYPTLYHARRDLGRIIANYGAGVPTTPLRGSDG